MDGLSALELAIKQLAPVNAPMPRQPEMSGLPMLHACHGAPVEVSQPPRLELPAAFNPGRKLPGYGNAARRAWKVVVQGGLCRRTQSEQKIHRHKVGPKNMGWETWSVECIGIGSFRIPLSPMLNPIHTCEHGLDLFPVMLGFSV